jgi:hypothetical protein
VGLRGYLYAGLPDTIKADGYISLASTRGKKQASFLLRHGQAEQGPPAVGWAFKAGLSKPGFGPKPFGHSNFSYHSVSAPFPIGQLQDVNLLSVMHRYSEEAALLKRHQPAGVYTSPWRMSDGNAEAVSCL